MAKLFGSRLFRKGDKIIEDIALKMMCTEEEAPEFDPGMVVSDEEILDDLKGVKDLEARDRDGRTLLINAAFYGRKSAVEWLLRNGANVAATDYGEFTALHAAAQEGFDDIIELLIAAGAPINARDDNGNTPLIISEYRSAIEILARNGADANIKNNHGISARDMFENYPDILSLFK